MIKKKSVPDIIELTEEELDSLFSRVEQNALTEEDKRLIKGAVQSNMWLKQALEAGKLTLYKLRRLLFGSCSEKREPAIKEKDADHQAEEDDLSCPLADSVDEEKPKRKGHGRLGANAYSDAEKVEIKHATLKVGDPCPEDCGGRMYQTDPGVYIHVTGSL